MAKLTLGPRKTFPRLPQKDQAAPNQQVGEELDVPVLAENVKEKIRQHWEKESQFQGYYNEANLSLFKILSQIEILPLTWWKGLTEEEYTLLQMVYCSSKIVGFRMIRSFRPLLKVFVALFPNL